MISYNAIDFSVICPMQNYGFKKIIFIAAIFLKLIFKHSIDN